MDKVKNLSLKQRQQLGILYVSGSNKIIVNTSQPKQEPKVTNSN